MKQFLLKLSQEDKTRLEQLAQAEHITQSAYIRRKIFLNSSVQKDRVQVQNKIK
jgi:predicted transcriptional regulator